jgi:hypothetical protein
MDHLAPSLTSPLQFMTTSSPGVLWTAARLAASARAAVAIVLMAALGFTPVFAQAPPTVPLPAAMGEFVRALPPGTNIKLKLTSGATVKGMLVTADDEAVTVRPRTRIPEPLRRVMLSEIADAELPRGSMVGKTVAIGAAIGAGAAIGFVFLVVLLYGSD